jgi:hypothetical protein
MNVLQKKKKRKSEGVSKVGNMRCKLEQDGLLDWKQYPALAPVKNFRQIVQKKDPTSNSVYAHKSSNFGKNNKTRHCGRVRETKEREGVSLWTSRGEQKAKQTYVG